MDKTHFFEKIEGKKLSITTDMFHIETDPIQIGLGGELQWGNNVVSFNWNTITDIEEYEEGAFSFWDSGYEYVVTII